MENIFDKDSLGWTWPIYGWVKYNFPKLMYLLPTEKLVWKECLPGAVGFVATNGRIVMYGAEWKKLWLLGRIK